MKQNKPTSAKSINRPLLASLAGVALIEGLYPWMSSEYCEIEVDYDFPDGHIETLPPNTPIDLRFIDYMDVSPLGLLVYPSEQADEAQIKLTIENNMRRNIAYFRRNEELFNKIGFKLLLSSVSLR